METNTNTNTSKLHIFRNESGCWIYKGDAGDLGMEILPTDKVGYDFPGEDNADLDGYESAAEAGIWIGTDTMNDIISKWVDAELPRNPAGYESQSEEDSIVVARGRRFEEIINMPDNQFRALYREKTGNELLPMNPDGSYTVIA